MQRRVSLQKHCAKKVGHKASRRQLVRQLRLSKLHTRLANIRKDAAHKLTTDQSRRFEMIVIEDLTVSGVAKNHSLAGALPCWTADSTKSGGSFGKQAMRGGVLADRLYPSTQICSCCGCLTGAKGRQESMSRNGFAANAVPSTRVTAMPQST